MNNTMPRETDRIDELVNMVSNIRERLARLEIGYLILLLLIAWLIFRGG